MRTAFAVFALMGIVSSAHAALDIETALNNARMSCGGISSELNTIKTLAGVGTGVSVVGALSGGAAVVTGVMKSDAVAEIKDWKTLLSDKQNQSDKSKIKYKKISQDEIDEVMQSAGGVSGKIDSLEQKSKTLGDIRTGTLAATTAANIAGAAVGGVNMKKARGSLSEQVSECLASIKDLSAAYGQARISHTASEEDLGRIRTIVIACDEWSTVDLSKIDNRATGAFASSVVGAVTGAAGTITSALANSEGVRSGDNATKEKNLNTASNVLAGGATVASTAATIFNATQISAIKHASTVAGACEGALR